MGPGPALVSDRGLAPDGNAARDSPRREVKLLDMGLPGARNGNMGVLGFRHSAAMASAALLIMKKAVMSRIPLIIAQMPAKMSSAAAWVIRN